MYLERLLQINMATLAALGTLLLGMGQRSAGLPLLVLVSALASVWLTDFTGLCRLNRAVANLAALVAVVISLRQLFVLGGQVQLLGLANLLVYLQVILMFQEKDLRSYRQLVMLSFLQVVVAALYSQGFWFGVMVVVYVLVGISALTLLLAHRQWRQYGVVGESVAAALRPGGRWPLAHRPAEISATPADEGHAGIAGELYLRLGWMSLGTVGLTLVVFLTVPRVGQSAWRGAVAKTRHVVGFSDTITLGEMGEILQDREEVLRLELTDPATESLCRLQGDLYLRGCVLSHYDRGQWRDTMRSPYRSRQVPRFDPYVDQPLFVQRITIEPLDSEELFCVWPPVALPVQPRRDDRLQVRGSRLVRPPSWQRRRMIYALGTTAIRDEVQTPLVPCQRYVRLRPLLQMPEDSQLPELIRLAAQWDTESGLPEHDRIGRARWLAERFHDPERFEYSLSGQTRDLSLDPVEDFIARNSRGHCEYFATALALMLRSRGIPSRVVSGFRCDEYNDLGGFYQVRQFHAHSWVEAYLEPGHLPLDALSGPARARFAHGGWLRLEPTPAAPGALVEGNDSLAGGFRRGVDWFESLWSNYVLEMDRRRQRDAVYQPAARMVAKAFRRLSDPAWWRAAWQQVADMLRLEALGALGRWLLAAVGVAAAAGIVVLLRRRLRGRWRRLVERLAGRPRRAPGPSTGQVEFYWRLELLLAHAGLTRRPGQTQREFAAAAGERLATSTGGARMQRLLVDLTDTFYRVRFGNLPLDDEGTAAVERALGELTASMASHTLGP